MMVIPETCHTR